MKRQTPSPFALLLAFNIVVVLYVMGPSIVDRSSSILDRYDASPVAGLALDQPLVEGAESSPLGVNKKRAAKAFGRHGQYPFGLSASHPHSLASHPRFLDSTAEAAVAPQVATPSSIATCEVCVHSPDDPLCEVGLDNVRLSRSYLGSGHRVRKVIEKAMRGEVVRIGVIGGSVSHGHGLDLNQTWHARWFDSFKADFPGAPHELHSGTVPAMDSAFFSYCYSALIPEDLDLYLIELDINNVSLERTYREDDALLRALLGLPQEPAVVRVSVVATSFPDLGLGHTSNLIQSTYFDTPSISIRNFMLPHFMAHPEKSEPFFSHLLDGNPDYRHISWIGHNVLADMLTVYFKEQICETRRRQAHPVAQPKGLWPQADVLGVVPRLYLWEPFSASKAAPPVKAKCEFSGSTRSPLTPLSDPALTDSSWATTTWNGKSALMSTKVGARIAFEFEGTRVGVHVYIQKGDRNPPEQPKPGRLGCWLNDEEQQRVVIDCWHDDPVSRSHWTMVKDNLPFAKHVVHCEILKESSTTGSEIRLLGVASQ